MAKIKVGRDSGCHVVLKDRTVSRLHGYLHLDDDGSIRFHDAGSTGGSYLVTADEEFVDLDDVDLSPDDMLVLGTLSISVLDLLDMAERNSSPGPETGNGKEASADDPGSEDPTMDVGRAAKVRRDPRTGAIIRDE